MNLVDRYRVELSQRAAKQLKGLDRTTQVRLVKTIQLLADHPRPPAARALAGQPGYLRVRVGDYRIVYSVNDGVLLVLVLAVGHRREIYRRLP